jgi:predicted nucleic acid-binding protein
MAAYYLDSSALAKLYLQEPGSQWVEKIVRPEEQPVDLLVFALIGVVETAAAIARFHRQKLMSQVMREAMFQLLIIDYRERFTLLSITQDVMLSAAELTQQYPLRGYDAVHLASALDFARLYKSETGNALIFVTADEVLYRAAQAAGLIVENPNNYP